MKTCKSFIRYGDEKYTIEIGQGRSYTSSYEGVIPNLERRHKETDSEFMRRDIPRGLCVSASATRCNGCQLAGSAGRPSTT